MRNADETPNRQAGGAGHRSGGAAEDAQRALDAASGEPRTLSTDERPENTADPGGPNPGEPSGDKQQGT